MTILMEDEQELDIGFDYENVLRQVIEKALELEKCPYECEVNVTFTDNEGIRNINRELIMRHRLTMESLKVTMHLQCILILKAVNYCLAILSYL